MNDYVESMGVEIVHTVLGFQNEDHVDWHMPPLQALAATGSSAHETDAEDSGNHDWACLTCGNVNLWFRPICNRPSCARPNPTPAKATKVKPSSKVGAQCDNASDPVAVGHMPACGSSHPGLTPSIRCCVIEAQVCNQTCRSGDVVSRMC